MTTVQGANGRRYSVTVNLYGTANYVYRLFYGGVFLASTEAAGPNGESSSTLEQAIARADARADKLVLEI